MIWTLFSKEYPAIKAAQAAIEVFDMLWAEDPLKQYQLPCSSECLCH
jgi:hypothetical protein